MPMMKPFDSPNFHTSGIKAEKREKKRLQKISGYVIILFAFNAIAYAKEVKQQ